MDTALTGDNIGKNCGQCETFSKCRSGFCPVTHNEVSRDHPACANFKVVEAILGGWKRASSSIVKDSSTEQHQQTHLKKYSKEDCIPEPERCILCPKYWTCQNVIDEVWKSVRNEEAEKLAVPKRDEQNFRIMY